MVRPMVRKVLAGALSALMVALCGCGVGVRASASVGIARFLAAAHDDDRKAFEAQLDRPALRDDLRRQLAELGRRNGLVVEGGASEFALDRMITPHAFHMVEARTGQVLLAAPSAAQVEQLLTVSDRGRACLRDLRRDRCLLVFVKEKGIWRLVAMQATDLVIAVAPPTK